MTILIIILAMIAIPFVLALFVSSESVIVRSITVNKPVEAVFGYIKLLKNSVYYNKWVMQDPKVRLTYMGTDGTVGFVSAWDSNDKQVGKGSQEITAISGQERIDYTIRFEKPFENTAYSAMETKSLAPGQTEVKMTFKGRRNYIMKVMQVILRIEKMLVKDIDATLRNLKQVLDDSNITAER